MRMIQTRRFSVWKSWSAPDPALHTAPFTLASLHNTPFHTGLPLLGVPQVSLRADFCCMLVIEVSPFQTACFFYPLTKRQQMLFNTLRLFLNN